MDESARNELERKLRELFDKADFAGAASEALRGYGPEIFGFMVSMHQSPDDASEVFASFSEDLWRGLPKFGWGCTFRTWAYTIARNASNRFLKGRHRRGKGQVPITGLSAEIAIELRSATVTYLKTESKDRFAALRESLPVEDQTLLILRVDRGLAWDELARIMLGEEPVPSNEDLKRESARLRKRFQFVKEKLLELGRAAGLIGAKDA
jgi:RNA polymerase sigma-70 factor, ECF subfamily